MITTPPGWGGDGHGGVYGNNLADRIRLQEDAERWNIRNVPGFYADRVRDIYQAGGNASNVARYNRLLSGEYAPPGGSVW